MRVQVPARYEVPFRLRHPVAFWGLAGVGAAAILGLSLLLFVRAFRDSGAALSSLGLRDPLADGRYLRDHAEWMTAEATPAKLQALVDALADKRPFDAVVGETGEWFPIKGTASDVRGVLNKDPYYESPMFVVGVYTDSLVKLVGEGCFRKVGRRFVVTSFRASSHDPFPRERVVGILRRHLDTDHPSRYGRDSGPGVEPKRGR